MTTLAATVSPLGGSRAYSPRALVELARREPMAASIVLVVLMVPFASIQVPYLSFALTDAMMMIPAALAATRLLQGARAPRSIVLAGLAVCVVGGVVSDAFGIDPAMSLRFAVHSVITLGFAAAIALAYRPGFDELLMRAFVVIGGVIAVETLSSAGSMQASDGGTVINGRLTGPFAQPNELGVFCALLLPLAIVTIVGTRSRPLLLLLSAATLALTCAWALSMSRGAWMGGTAALVALAVCEPTTRRLLRSAAVVLIATLAAAFVLPTSTPVLGLLGQRIQSLGHPTENQYDDRPLIWSEAFSQINSRPWLGEGSGGYQTAAADSSSPISVDPATHPHDLVLTVLTERGVVGLALSTVVVVGCIVAARRCLIQRDVVLAVDRRLRATGIAVFGALTALTIHTTLDMPLRNPIVSAVVWTVLGLAVTVDVSTLEHEERWVHLAGTPVRTNPRRAGVS